MITVKDSEGDNFSTEKDTDMALVDEVIIPAIKQDLDIDHILSDSNRKEIFRMAMKKWAEEAKIKLSYYPPMGNLPIWGDSIGGCQR